MSLVLKVCKLSNADENVVLIVARCLPHIVPNVLLNKREVSNDRPRTYCTTACVESGCATKAHKPTLQYPEVFTDNGVLVAMVALPLTLLRFCEAIFVEAVAAFLRVEKRR